MSIHLPIASLSSCLALLLVCPGGAARAAGSFAEGDAVRLTRGEMLLSEGKNFLGAPKGQEFTVLKRDPGTVQVAFYKEDGSALAVTLPADALEPSPPDALRDLLRGVQAFRDGRYDVTRRFLARAAEDAPKRALATALSSRIHGALNAAGAARSGTAASRQALATTLQALRDAALQLHKLGHLSLALWLDEGADRLGGPTAPPTRLERAELAKRVALSHRALVRGRQAVALHRLMEASRLLDAGLEAEPARADLLALRASVTKELADAEESHADAVRMRRFANGAVHVLTAIERGLKACADHPQLRAMKTEMQSLFEERTAPPVTPAFLAAAKVSTPPAALAEGHRLYTTRCTECHDLELLDSRGIAGWQRAVGGMARRAGLSAAEQTRILDYLAAAQNGLEDKSP